MEDDLLSLVPFKLMLIIMSDDFKDIIFFLTPTPNSNFYYLISGCQACVYFNID